MDSQFFPRQPLQFIDPWWSGITTSGIGGNDSYTVLLLHMDGTDASTTFTDSSASAHTMTVNGNAQIDTAQSVFGGASGLFDGSSGHLTTTINSDFNFGTGDLTIDFRVRLTSNKSYNVVWMQRSASEYIRFRSTGKIDVQGPSGVIFNAAGSSALSTGTWYHIAVVRSGNNWTVYKDGTSWATTTNSFSFGGSTGDWHLGAQATSTNVLDGWLDEVRFSKGIARWTADFTPPTQAYS